jgi:hypothetical protein
MASAEELEERVAYYKEVTAPGLIEEIGNGGPIPGVLLKARAELAECNFGLSNQEYAEVVGEGEGATDRYEKVCRVAGWLIDNGVALSCTPGEILRAHSSGWPGLTAPEEIKPFLELLASQDEEDFMLLKRSLEELLGCTDRPFEN